MKTAFGENAQYREFAEGLQVSVIVTAHDLTGAYSVRFCSLSGLY